MSNYIITEDEHRPRLPNIIIFIKPAVSCRLQDLYVGGMKLNLGYDLAIDSPESYQ